MQAVGGGGNGDCQGWPKEGLGQQPEATERSEMPKNLTVFG